MALGFELKTIWLQTSCFNYYTVLTLSPQNDVLCGIQNKYMDNNGKIIFKGIFKLRFVFTTDKDQKE